MKRIDRVCKDIAVEDIYRPSGHIVRDIFGKNANTELMSKANTVRSTNAARQRLRPKPPRQSDKNFEPQANFVKQEFYRGKCTVVINGEAATFYIFASDYQWKKLIAGKRLCFDGFL